MCSEDTVDTLDAVLLYLLPGWSAQPSSGTALVHRPLQFNNKGDNNRQEYYCLLLFTAINIA